MLNKRDFTRVSPVFGVKLVTNGRIIRDIHTVNISLGGALLGCNEPIDIDTDCDFELALNSHPTTISIRATGKTVRRDEEGLAIRFERIDVDSFRHLEQLVLQNSRDPQQTLREINTHAGIMSH